MKYAWLLISALCTTGCLTAWDVGGPWACPDSGVCGGDLVCDDGVCCQPNGKPACPTLPAETGCPQGSSPALYFRDSDGDGAGDPLVSRAFCKRPVKEKWVIDAGDCDDHDVGIGPAAPERCNAIDDDCNGVVDDGPGMSRLDWKLDIDGDGFGDDCASCKKLSCAQPAGYVALGGDCNATNPAVFPGAPEKCNGVDDNCNQQLDDPPFSDVENPGLDGGRFDCDTLKPGVCQAGGTQCVFSGGSFAAQCVARVAASTDTCGNQKDDDCSGGVDDRPGCGGPSNFLTEPGVTMGAFWVPLPAQVPTNCLKGSAGAFGQAWLNPVWIGSDVHLHVWWAEAPEGAFWDLSGSTSLHLPLNTSPVNGAREGLWATDPAGFPNAVVVLCGPNGVMRYVPTGAARVNTQLDLRLDVPLGGSATWALSGAPQSALRQVTRVEVWVSPRTPDAGIVTFSNTFLVDAGTPGFR